MKVLTVVGKVDTRALVYPLSRALSLLGLTSIITDDGAYRRLYHGDSLQGTVNGIDISVGLMVDNELNKSLSSSGVPYDYKIVVSSGYIPEDTTGLLICHGVDNSIMGVTETEDETSNTSDIRKDTVDIPDGIPAMELHISYSQPSVRNITSILLKESFINYVYTCEEMKTISVYPDRAYNKLLAKILNELLNIGLSDAMAVLERAEYQSGNRK